MKANLLTNEADEFRQNDVSTHISKMWFLKKPGAKRHLKGS